MYHDIETITSNIWFTLKSLQFIQVVGDTVGIVQGYLTVTTCWHIKSNCVEETSIYDSLYGVASVCCWTARCTHGSTRCLSISFKFGKDRVSFRKFCCHMCASRPSLCKQYPSSHGGKQRFFRVGLPVYLVALISTPRDI